MIVSAMKHGFSFALTLVACAFASTLVTVAASGQSAPAQNGATATPENDPAAGLFAQTCNKCHDAARITAMRRTGTEWEEVINKMIEKGATGTEKDFETIYTYVLRYYGKLYINNATPDDITLIIGLSKKDADAIVGYRKANGSFADFDAVKKVPDIDVKKLEERRDAIAF
jgi:competence protein ComEA